QGHTVVPVGGDAQIHHDPSPQPAPVGTCRPGVVLAGHRLGPLLVPGKDRGQLRARGLPSRGVHGAHDARAHQSDPHCLSPPSAPGPTATRRPGGIWPGYLMDPAISPRMSWREKIRYSTTAGTMDKLKAASTAFQSLTNCPRNTWVPKIRVLVRSPGARMRANHRSFQMGSRLMAATVPKAGRARGSISQ